MSATRAPGGEGVSLRIELVGAERDLLAAIADPSCNRDNIVQDYAYALFADVSTGGSQQIDWPKANAAILERYSPGGLRYIKDSAWRIIKRASA